MFEAIRWRCYAGYCCTTLEAVGVFSAVGRTGLLWFGHSLKPVVLFYLCNCCCIGQVVLPVPVLVSCRFGCMSV
jgi:hypothetical protein